MEEEIIKIEYIKEGSPECPLIRIYGKEPESCQILRKSVLQLSKKQIKTVTVHLLPIFTGVDGCELYFELGENIGILETGNNKFRCILNETNWINVEGLLEPFCRTTNGYQWLYDLGNIKLLFSTDGNW